MIGIVVDAELQIEARRRDLLALVRPEMDDRGERPAHVDAGGVISKAIVEDQSDAEDAHRN
jgi:hypothetical protein